jgi:hypothetical protein
LVDDSLNLKIGLILEFPKNILLGVRGCFWVSFQSLITLPLDWKYLYKRNIMENINDKIVLLRTELNLTNEPMKRTELNKQLNILLLRKEIEQIKKRIEQLSNS